MKLSFEGLEATLQYDLIKTEDGRHIPIKLTAKKTEEGHADADLYEVTIDGVLWLTTESATHGVILYTLLRDNVTDFMHYVTTGNDYYYYFDCMDGELSERYFTPEELSKTLYKNDEALTESQIIRIAKEYEATLYRYEKTQEGDYINETLLYDCMDI